MSTHKAIDKICCVVVALSLILTLLFMNARALGVAEASSAKPYETRLFDTSVVHTIDIIMDDWDSFISGCTDEEYALCSVVIDNEAYKNVAIRAKGNTSLTQVASYGNNRYSFKIEFDHYDSTKSYYGLDKLSLNNIIQDNTYMKDFVTYRMMAEFGVDAPLCSFVNISVNGESWGLYLAVESVEEAFLERNYGKDYGELYKPDSLSMGGGRGNGNQFNMDDWNAALNEESIAQIKSVLEAMDDSVLKNIAEKLGYSGTDELFSALDKAGSIEDILNGTDLASLFSDMSGHGQGGGDFRGGRGEQFGQQMQNTQNTDNQQGAMPQMSDNGSFGGTMPQMSDNGSFGGAMPQMSDNGSFDGAMPQMSDNGSFDGAMPQMSDNGSSDGTMPQMSDSGSFDGTMPQMPDNGSFDGTMPQMPDGGGFDGAMPDMGNFGGSMGSDAVKLVYTDDDYDSYSEIFNNAKTDITDADRDRLIEALKKLGNNEDIAEVVDVDEVLRYFVVHNFVCNFDSYTGSMIHNYYLYENDGQLSMIPWDYNLAFGGFQDVSDASTLINYPIDSPVSGGTVDSRPMLAWIFNNEEYTELYHSYFAEFISSCFDSGSFAEMLDYTKELIVPYVESDPTKFCTYEEFQTGSETLKEFCLLRAQSVKGQLEGTIASTSDAQKQDSASLVDASGINISDMGSMGNGMGGKGMGGMKGGNELGDMQPQFSPGNAPEQGTAMEMSPQMPPEGQNGDGNAPQMQQGDELPQMQQGETMPQMQQGENSMPEPPGDMGGAPDFNAPTAEQNDSSMVLITLGISCLALILGLVCALSYKKRA